jgi:transcriptional regulator with XRE-family HTH domain
MATMGDRIESERKAKGWTQQRLADEVNRLGGHSDQSRINGLEKRASRNSSQAIHIARALGVNLEWLLTGKGPKSGLSSIDAKLQLLPPDDYEDVADDIHAIIDRRLEKRGIRQQ